jgi:hypothetical protein
MSKVNWVTSFDENNNYIISLENKYKTSCKLSLNEILNTTVENKTSDILVDKKSNYNNKLYMDECSICGDNGTVYPLDTHHIKEQNTFDNNDIHKDKLSNLVVLCKKHHDEVHYGDLEIIGYKDTITGISLSTYGPPSNPFIADSAIISTCSKDSSLKVVNATISQRNVNFSVKRTFTAAESPFSSCSVTKDGKLDEAKEQGNVKKIEELHKKISELLPCSSDQFEEGVTKLLEGLRSSLASDKDEKKDEEIQKAGHSTN